MEILFFILMVCLLMAFGYAQQERGVFRTPGVVALNQDDDSVVNSR